MEPGHFDVDVAIVGGGPAGSTCGSLLRKYSPSLRVLILEKERFPREHVGESQLPLICHILNEMGVWEKVEAAGFPVKLGATYRWGNSPGLWDFGFLPFNEFRDEPRPARFAGQRLRTAFQVDRALYDAILLDHAAEVGCEVRQGTPAASVAATGDRVDGLTLADGSSVRARHYVDATGVSSIIRRGVNVGISYPTNLRNIAMWDYWTNAEWAVSVGRGGTRVLVLSIGCGWLWFIPVSPTRTSIGFITPAQHYKHTSQTPEQLYAWAVRQEPLLAELTANATREGKVRTTRDWSSLSDRAAGENWFLVGDAAGFGDPILAAGLMLSHASAREAAYTILELDRAEHDAAWLRERYDRAVRKRIRQHIRFADFWYAANGRFTDLEEHTAVIAGEAGLRLSPKEAFRWLANGGFTDDVLGRAGVGGVDFSMVMHMVGEIMSTPQKQADAAWKISEFNIFKPNLADAREEFIPVLAGGRIRREKCLVRADRTLPVTGIYGVLLQILSRFSHIDEIRQQVIAYWKAIGVDRPTESQVMQFMQGLEVMLTDGWVWGQYNPGRPRFRIVRMRHQSVVPDSGSDRPRVNAAADAPLSEREAV